MALRNAEFPPLDPRELTQDPQGHPKVKQPRQEEGSEDMRTEQLSTPTQKDKSEEKGKGHDKEKDKEKEKVRDELRPPREVHEDEGPPPPPPPPPTESLYAKPFVPITTLGMIGMTKGRHMDNSIS